MNEHILIIEDEEDILELVKFNLEKQGFHVNGAATGELGLEAARSSSPELIILDLMLPGIHGLEICRLLKDGWKTRHIPIIMLTAKSEDSDIVTGLNLGADDYITKPFSPRVIVARVLAVLRRKLRESADVADDLMVRGDIMIHTGRHEVLIQGEKRHLTSTEFRILHFLANRPGWVFTRDQIVGAVHSDDYHVTSRSVDVQVMGLRKKLGSAGEYIETVRGVGYRFRD